MIVECRNCHEEGCTRDGGCIVAAFHALEPNRPDQPERPEWILSKPECFDERELEALAVLSDAGLVPPLMPAMSAPSARAGQEPEEMFWPVGGPVRRVG